MEQRRLSTSLLIAQLVAVATLLRSVAFDRWITVLAAILLFAGATAATRGKTWGVALALMAAVSFPVAFLIGIAPAWFALVGLAGMMPFMISLPAFTQFDKRATALLVMLASTLGAAGAIGWKMFAWDIFREFPSLLPSVELTHPLAIAAIAAAGVAITAKSQRKAQEAASVRIAMDAPVSHVRIAGLEAEDEEAEFEEKLAKRRSA